MFCTRCGKPVPDGANFCSGCGAPVTAEQEASPVPQHPAGMPDETANIQAAENPREVLKASGKKSGKRLIIGLSVSCLLLAVLAVAMMFAFGQKSGSSDPIPVNIFAYDKKYTYYLYDDQGAHRIHIMRIDNRMDGEPQSIHSFEIPAGEPYSIGNLFLWDGKICYGDGSGLWWLDKDHEATGAIATAEELVKQAERQIDGWDDQVSLCQPWRWYRPYLEGDTLTFYTDSRIGHSWYVYRLNLRTGNLSVEDGAIRDERGWFHMVACKGDVSYYVFTRDSWDESLYRKTKDSDLELVAELPEGYMDWNFVPKGEYLYFQTLQEHSEGWTHHFYRIDTKNGGVEHLSSTQNMEYQSCPFALSGEKLYYTYRNTRGQKLLCGIDLKTLRETHYNVPDELLRQGATLEFSFSTIYPGPDNSCIFAPYWDNRGYFFDYVTFRPEEYTWWARNDGSGGEISVNPTEPEYTQPEETEATEPEERYTAVDGATIVNTTGYQNGYNYVTFDNGTSAVFDKEGMELARFPFVMEYEYTKWLSDDLLVVARDGSSGMPRNEEFVILSLSEGITYDSSKNEEQDWTYLGGDGNTILVQRYLQGFNIDATYQIGFTDQYGSEPETWFDSVEDYYYDFDLGDGMYLLYTGDMENNGMLLCNLSEKEIFPLSESPGVPLSSASIRAFKTQYFDEFAVFYGEKKMDKSGNISAIFPEGTELFAGSDDSTYGEGLFGFSQVGTEGNYKSGYFDINGNCVVDLTQYTQRYWFNTMGTVLNGHTGVILEAIDNEQLFYACFDTQGNLMYEPFFVEDNSVSVTMFDGGYFITSQNGVDTFYDITGETYRPLEDDMSFLPDNVTFQGGNAYADGLYRYSEGIFTVLGDAGTGEFGRYVPCYKFYRKDGTELTLQRKADPTDGAF